MRSQIFKTGFATLIATIGLFACFAASAFAWHTTFHVNGEGHTPSLTIHLEAGLDKKSFVVADKSFADVQVRGSRCLDPNTSTKLPLLRGAEALEDVLGTAAFGTSAPHKIHLQLSFRPKEANIAYGGGKLSIELPDCQESFTFMVRFVPLGVPGA